MVGVALVESFSHRLLLGPVASDLAISTVQLLAYLIIFDRWVNRVVAFVGLAAAVASQSAHYMLPPSYPQESLRRVNHCAQILLFGYATIVMLRNIFEQRVVRSDDVLGAVCGYLLAAGAWASHFMLIEIFVPGSFIVGQWFGAGLDSSASSTLPSWWRNWSARGSPRRRSEVARWRPGRARPR